MPHGCVWGLFDKDGKKDEIGMLNTLTTENTREALKEIKTGERIQLDWGLENVEFPGFNRKPFEQKILDLASIGFVACDDEIHINTQSGSQWDGFRHVAHQTSKLYYNGLHHDEIIGGSKQNGIHNWCANGGIAGRGVLLDWVRWCEKTGKEVPHPCTQTRITIKELEEVAKFQGTTFKPYDILLVRSGFVRWHEKANQQERKTGTQDHNDFIGVEATEESKAWLWDHHFAAVVGDTVAFEKWPPNDGVILHEWLLTFWGAPIGEMWDLEKLAAACERENRWSFFLSSAPLNVKGGVGSTPNAIAYL